MRRLTGVLAFLTLLVSTAATEPYTPPTLDQLNADFAVTRQIYEVGYLIGEFVVARFGQAALTQLIRANGDTAAVLGLSAQAFQDAWYAYVRERYLS